MPRLLTRFVLAPVVLLAAAGLARAEAEQAAAPEFTAEELEFFETKVRPVLANNCYACHSHDHLKEGLKSAKGGVYLDSRLEAIEANIGDPGVVADSVLVESVRYDGPTKPMPPAGKLPDHVIADLTKWVEMGMPWPKESGPASGEVFDLEARRAAHWAWETPKRAAELPKVEGLDDSANVIDRFVEAKLAEQELEPGPAADKATLIRRVTLDLTGLPPTAEEVEAFVSDASPDAYAKLVDRLLASPRFGEKWARHWLDSVRYAESYGHEFDYNIPHAWKYRDYVIRALNDDLPYDRFVKEHLAGDLVAPRIHEQTQVNEAVVATGWWYMHEQTHAPTDVRQHESERINNQIDVLSKTLMGMTVACARCHDHKFDAIGDEDFYALAGFMQSSRQQQAYLDKGGKIEAVLSDARVLLDEGQAAFDQLDADEPGPARIDHASSRLFEDFNDGTYAGWHATGWAWGDRPTIKGQWDSRRSHPAAVWPGVAHSGLLGDKPMGTLRSAEFDLDDRNIWLRVYGKGQVKLILDSYTMDRYNRLLYEGFSTSFDTKGQWQWIKVHDRRGLFFGKGQHRGHLEIIDDDPESFIAIDEVRIGGDQAPPNPDTAKPQAVPGEHHRLSRLPRYIFELTAKAPNPERALAILDGSPEDSYVHIRGSYKGIGETIARRTLTALGGKTMSSGSPNWGSGRLGLAESLVEPTNPLTARVQVNRLWHHLFGTGIVPTVDNFGVLGTAPSHPELLDHLAVVFAEDDGWSNKAMIRRIVMSRAYQRTSDRTDPAAESKDPTNKLLHRQHVRRLTGEAIRDSILAVSGSLNEKQFGPSVGVHLTRDMQGRGRPKSGPLDGQGRRSIYISVRRNFLSPMMLTFDMPIPFTAIGRRNVSNVPAQSLMLMNDPFVHDQADKWAKRLMNDGSTTTAERIDRVYRTAIGRPTNGQERDAILAYIHGQYGTDHPEAHYLQNEQLWRDLCHAVFNAKGFIFVR